MEEKIIETDIVPTGDPSENRHKYKVIYKPEEIKPGHYLFSNESVHVRLSNGSLVNVVQKKKSKKERAKEKRMEKKCEGNI